MRIALAQINPTVGDFSGNLKKIAEFVDRAAAEGAALVMFPELATCGYPPADLLEKASFVARAEETLAAVAELTRVVGRPAVLCGSPMRCEGSSGKGVRNVAALMEDGEIKFVQQKMLLPFYDVFDEQRYFEPAKQQALTVVKGQAVAITICEDAWNDKMFWPRQMYPVDPIDELMRQWAMLPQPLSGHRLILNISASPFWHGKLEVRQRMIGALAKRHRATVVCVHRSQAWQSWCITSRVIPATSTLASPQRSGTPLGDGTVQSAQHSRSSSVDTADTVIVVNVYGYDAASSA